MVPNLIWAPEFLGPHKIWALRNLGPKKASFEKAMTTFMRGPYILGTKFLGAQISQGTNFVGPKKVRVTNENGDHFSYSRKIESCQKLFFIILMHNVIFPRIYNGEICIACIITRFMM